MFRHSETLSRLPGDFVGHRFQKLVDVIQRCFVNRLENRIADDELAKFSKFFVELFLESYDMPPKEKSSLMLTQRTIRCMATKSAITSMAFTTTIVFYR